MIQFLTQEYHLITTLIYDYSNGFPLACLQIALCFWWNKTLGIMYRSPRDIPKLTSTNSKVR